MVIVEINSGNHGSVGNIMLVIAERACNKGHEVHTYCPPGHMQKQNVKGNKFIGTIFERRISDLINSMTGSQGALNLVGTSLLLRELDQVKPDIVHFHNLHSNYINLRMLFRYVKKHKIRVVWTLHDCWAFTGHCPHFDLEGCEKWKTMCGDCRLYKEYPQSFFDDSEKMFKRKKGWFCGVDALTLVTPSEWIKKMAEQSFLKEYPVQVINNGIDLCIFQPRANDFREKYNCKDKFVIIGVAFSWGYRKGLDVFAKLSGCLSSQYQIVLVGTNEEIDIELPEGIISIHRTQNQIELAEIYTAADVLLNPTREEAFGLVNVEALACGTPVITFRSGGSPECIDDSCGVVIERDDFDGLLDAIQYIEKEHPFSNAVCRKRAERFDKNDKFMEYVELYEC